MKFEVIIFEDDYEGEHLHVVKKDGEYFRSVSNLCECPEDATVYRDLVNGKDIVRYIKMGYNLAKAGEELEIEIRNALPDEEY